MMRSMVDDWSKSITSINIAWKLKVPKLFNLFILIFDCSSHLIRKTVDSRFSTFVSKIVNESLSYLGSMGRGVYDIYSKNRQLDPRRFLGK